MATTANDTDLICCICLVEINTATQAITTLKCGHIMHAKCAAPLFAKDGNNVLCPLCRSESDASLHKLDSHTIHVTIESCPDGARNSIEVLASGNVSTLMHAIEVKLGVPVQTQRLIFLGKLLKFTDNLNTNGIRDGSKIHLVNKTTKPKPVPEEEQEQEQHKSCQVYLLSEYENAKKTWRSVPYSSKPEIQIFVKTLTNRTWSVCISPSDYIGHIMLKIQETHSLPVEQQRLIFNGRQVFHDHFVSEYNIQQGATLDLILRLSGGKPIICIAGPVNADVIAVITLRDSHAKMCTVWPSPHHYGPTDIIWSSQYTAATVTLKDSRGCESPYMYYEFTMESLISIESYLRPKTTSYYHKPSYMELSNILYQICTNQGLDVKNRADFITWWLTQMKPKGILYDRHEDRDSYLIDIHEDADYDELVGLNLTILAKGLSFPLRTHRFFMFWATVDATSEETKTMIPVMQKHPVWNEKAKEMFCCVEWGGCHIPCKPQLPSQTP